MAVIYYVLTKKKDDGLNKSYFPRETIKYLCRTQKISIIRMSSGKLTAQFIFKVLYKNKLINPSTLDMIK